MNKYLKILDNTKKHEKDINNIIPEISFLSAILRKESFVEEIKTQLLSFSEIASNFKIIIQFTFLFTILPIWIICELFSLKYNIRYFAKKFANKFIFTNKYVNQQQKVFDLNKKNINKYKEIIGENNFFDYLQEKETTITQEDFDTITIRNESVICIESKLKELHESFTKDPKQFTDYFNYYANAKKDIEMDINFIAKSLNEYIVKNKTNKEEKQNNAKILKFHKKS